MNQYVEGINNSGTMTVSGSAVGRNASVVAMPTTSPSAREQLVDKAQIGVITILPLETRALKLAFDLRSERVGGLTFYKGEVDGTSVVSIMALGQGQRSAMAAYNNLVSAYDPEIVALLGIGGGFHKSLGVGDVVVSTEMVYYDLRKIMSNEVRRRGESRVAPAVVGHAVNAFFTDIDPPRLTIHDPNGTARSVGVHSGAIGSGEAVIADEDAAELEFLASFNDKILAVDMEAGGLGQACHERSAGSGRQHPWMVIRGISDRADQNKNDEPQRLASWHAAQVLRRLLPYLKNG